MANLLVIHSRTTQGRNQCAQQRLPAVLIFYISSIIEITIASNARRDVSSIGQQTNATSERSQPGSQRAQLGGGRSQRATV